jgi:hypothetical protein
MYLAHTAPGLAAKGTRPEIPLWFALLASWSIDLTGVGHWLMVLPVLIVVLVLAAYKFYGRTAAFVIGAVVAVDYTLDLVTGVQVWPGGELVGPLWGRRNPGVDFLIEGCLLVIGWLIYRRSLATGQSRRMSLLVLVVVLAGQLAADTLLPIPPAGRERHHIDPSSQLGMVIIIVVVLALVLLIDGQSRRLMPTSVESRPYL